MQMRFIYLLILISMSAFSQMSDDPRSWTVVTDQVMGGKSELEANYDEGTFQLKGYVTTENNGGFVRLAHRPDSIDKNTKGIKFMAKGNDETYEIHVTMKGIKLPPWAYHSQSFDVGSEWKEYFYLEVLSWNLSQGHRRSSLCLQPRASSMHWQM